MKLNILTITVLFFLSAGCKKRDDVKGCPATGFEQSFASRNFSMGFTTWPFGPDDADRKSTYQFINDHADIYSEQMDHYIPWAALVNNQILPQSLTEEVMVRKSLKPLDHKLLLSVSLLNIERTDLLADLDGFIPAYVSLDDSVIVAAYTRYLKYLVDQYRPDYLVLAMEVNEFKIKNESKWQGYTSLIHKVKSALKLEYPALKMAESVTLHNWYLPNVPDPETFITEITAYVNQQDFVAISFYPFLKGLYTGADFQKAFDFLHGNTSKPIAFVETGHIAEDLSVPAFNVSVKGDVCGQREYLEKLLLNAATKDYEFVIWWTHRDYDRLWQIFPAESKDIGLLWKDTGLLTGEGSERPSLTTWKFALDK